MALLAMCMPILPGKMDKWKAMMAQIKSTPDFANSRVAAGVHERSLHQVPGPGRRGRHRRGEDRQGQAHRSALLRHREQGDADEAEGPARA